MLIDKNYDVTNKIKNRIYNNTQMNYVNIVIN